MNQVIKLENSVFNINPFKGKFKVMSKHHNDIHILHTENLSRSILKICDTIVVVKNKKELWNSEKFKLWEELCKSYNKIEEVNEIIKKQDSSYYLKEIISEKSGDDIFYFHFAKRELLDEFIKYLADEDFDLVIYSTTEYSNDFVLNQFLVRELKLNNIKIVGDTSGS